MKQQNRKKYPKNQEEAFQMMDALLTDDNKRDALKTQDDEEFASEQHFGLGLWVRNNWIIGGNVEHTVLTGEKNELESDDSEVPLFGMTPDYLSTKFVELYHKHLRETFNE